MASIWKTKHSVALLGAGCGAAIPFFAPVVMAGEEKKSCHSGHVKPSQLPIYDDPQDLFDISYEVTGKGQLQEGVEVVRKELCGAVEATKEFRDEVTRIYETGKAHTAGQIAYLREEENLTVRSAAIAVGGVLGFMLGARGRFFKKLLYTSAGAAGTAAVLYPQYSRQYTQEALDAANSYSTVAYNFLVGVKPQTKEDSDNTSSAAASSASKADGKVEVSNLYPSLLTLPHSSLFTKREQKNYWPYVKAVKEGPIITQGKSLDRIAEEASQVSTLGFRLQERESDPIQGFGSVAEHVVGEEDNFISGHTGASDAAFFSTKQDEKVEVEPQFQERASIVPLSSEGIEKDSDEKFIDKLIDETKKVIEVADKVVKDAKLVEKVSEQVEKVSEVIPVVGETIESVAEFVQEAATVVEKFADGIKEVAETVEVLEVAEAERESVPTSELMVTANQAKDKKISVFKKVSNFFSSSDAPESVSSNLTTSVSTGSEFTLKVDREGEKSFSNISVSGSDELSIVEPIQESDAVFGDHMSSPTDSTPVEADSRISETSEKNAFDLKLEILPQKNDLSISEKKHSPPVRVEGQFPKSLVLDDSKVSSNLPETNQGIHEATKSQELLNHESSQVVSDVMSEEKSSLFSKIADFFSTDSSATENSSPKSSLNNDIAGNIEAPGSAASNAGTNWEKTEKSKSDITGVSVVQKPKIPDSLLKTKVGVSLKQDDVSSLSGESLPAGKYEPRSQVSDSTKASAPGVAPKPSETSKSSGTLMKTASPIPNVSEVCEPETRLKEHELVSRVRDEGGFTIIESPGSEGVFAVLEEASKNEPKESPSEAKTTTEDHGQSNPNDHDMYTTSEMEKVSNSVKVAKTALRQHMKNVLKNIDQATKDSQSAAVTRKVLASSAYKQSERLAFYLSMTDEINTSEILTHALESGKTCFIPRYDSRSRHMEMVRLHSRADYDSLPETSWKIKQPPLDEPREAALETGGLDLVLVPGLAFTAAGHRLGRGRGYYDTFLSKLVQCQGENKAHFLALAFSEQLVQEVPTDASDVLVHSVIVP
ncbi:5-formyltetrahydrofolate cyclo-ligase [Trinorchestia longiramus]|nr:5-formyltetrahydrofolate cyclo-ligase [Trinorchestia longiramus]